MASYPWESNAGAQGFSDVREQGGGGGGGGPFGEDAAVQADRQAMPHTTGKGLHDALGPINGKAEDYSDYGAGGPGLEE